MLLRLSYVDVDSLYKAVYWIAECILFRTYYYRFKSKYVASEVLLRTYLIIISEYSKTYSFWDLSLVRTPRRLASRRVWRPQLFGGLTVYVSIGVGLSANPRSTNTLHITIYIM